MAAGGIGPASCHRRESFSAAQENFRHRLREPINAFCFIAQLQKGFPVLGDCPEQGILHFIDVRYSSIMISSKRRETSLRCRRPLSVLLQEQTDCQVLPDHCSQGSPSPVFSSLISLRKVQRQPLQVTEQRIGAAQVPPACLAVWKKKSSLNSCNAPLARRAATRRSLPVLLVSAQCASARKVSVCKKLRESSSQLIRLCARLRTLSASASPLQSRAEKALKASSSAQCSAFRQRLIAHGYSAPPSPLHNAATLCPHGVVSIGPGSANISVFLPPANSPETGETA